tara:strand:- start:5974 stop:6858 length:885 start_codon:yes stop_codon:yes gene_type:complete
MDELWNLIRKPWSYGICCAEGDDPPAGGGDPPKDPPAAAAQPDAVSPAELAKRMSEMEGKNTELGNKVKKLAIPEDVKGDPAKLLEHFGHDPDMMAVERYSQMVGADEEPTPEAQFKKLNEATTGLGQRVDHQAQQQSIDRAKLELRLQLAEMGDKYPVAKSWGTEAFNHLFPLLQSSWDPDSPLSVEDHVASVLPDLEKQLMTMTEREAKRAQALSGSVEALNPYGAPAGQQAKKAPDGKPAPAAPQGAISSQDGGEGAPPERAWKKLSPQDPNRIRAIVKELHARKQAEGHQ